MGTDSGTVASGVAEICSRSEYGIEAKPSVKSG